MRKGWSEKLPHRNVTFARQLLLNCNALLTTNLRHVQFEDTGGHRWPPIGYDSAARYGSGLAPVKMAYARQCALMAERFFSDSDSESSDSKEYLHSSAMCNESSQLNIEICLLQNNNVGNHSMISLFLKAAMHIFDA